MYIAWPWAVEWKNTTPQIPLLSPINPSMEWKVSTFNGLSQITKTVKIAKLIFLRRLLRLTVKRNIPPFLLPRDAWQSILYRSWLILLRSIHDSLWDGGCTEGPTHTLPNKPNNTWDRNSYRSTLGFRYGEWLFSVKLLYSSMRSEDSCYGNITSHIDFWKALYH